MAIEQTQDSARRLEHLLLTREIEEFLYAEAALLDERRFEEWLVFLTDDIRYWMPMRRNVKFGQHERENTRERQDMNWFDEGKTTLQQRVRQIMTGVHWAEEPLSRVCHMVTNVQNRAGHRHGGHRAEPLPWCTATGCKLRPTFVGKREDVLRKVDEAWKIARRQILLDQNVLLAKNLTVFF
jgi:3-phenylpropionate/cinnamic acid dioxygenase small subunit